MIDWARRLLAVAVGVCPPAGCGVLPPPVDSRAEEPPGSRDPVPGESGDDSSHPLDRRLAAVLEREPPVVDGGRNPFQFGSASGGVGAASGGAPSAPAAGDRRSAMPAGPAAGSPASGPGPEGADTIRFIGIVEASRGPGRVAVVTDGGEVYHGLVNDVVRGRYRIVAIDETSLEVEDVARGVRMTLRLSGA